MPIRIQCPTCRNLLDAEDRLAGGLVQCPHCRGVIRVPMGAVAAAGGSLSAGQGSAASASIADEDTSFLTLCIWVLAVLVMLMIVALGSLFLIRALRSGEAPQVATATAPAEPAAPSATAPAAKPTTPTAPATSAAPPTTAAKPPAKASSPPKPAAEEKPKAAAKSPPAAPAKPVPKPGPTVKLAQGFQFSTPGGWKAVEPTKIKVEAIAEPARPHVEQYLKSHPEKSCFIQLPGTEAVRPTVCILQGTAFIQGSPQSGSLAAGTAPAAGLLASQMATLAAAGDKAPPPAAAGSIVFQTIAEKEECCYETRSEGLVAVGVTIDERWYGEPITFGVAATPEKLSQAMQAVEAIVAEIEAHPPGK